jgi:NTP-dependent ternary system trypsin peptidase co-occuring protein
MSTPLPLELAEAIEVVRRELLTAYRAGQASEMPFEVGPVQLEFNISVVKERSVEGGVKAWVIAAGSSATRSLETGHRVTLTLTPRLAGRKGPVEVGD